jgi:hypothetical protein
MERIATLIEKLQSQLSEGASASAMLMTVQMLQTELQQQDMPAGNQTIGQVSVTMPNVARTMPEPIMVATPKMEGTPVPEEKIVEMLQVDEAAIEAELEEIKLKAKGIQQISTTSRPGVLFEDVLDELPTYVQHKLKRTEVNTTGEESTQKELNEVVGNSVAVQTSLNDLLKEDKKELSETILAEPIKDLKKGISINDRHLFINDLFRGDEAMFDRSIKTINGFHIFSEAAYWMQRELFLKLAWDDKHETTQAFMQLIKRRFN